MSEKKTPVVVDYTADDIKTLHGIQHIRYRPEMYLGSTHTNKAEAQLLKEVVDNASDEATTCQREDFVAHLLLFTNKDRTAYQACITDNGRGIPLEKLTASYTVPGTGAKFEGRSFVGSTGTFGIGAKAAAAMCRRFVGMSNRPDGMAMTEVRDAIVVRETREATLTQFNFGTTAFLDIDASRFPRYQHFMTDPLGWPSVLKVIEFLGTFNRHVRFEVREFPSLVPESLFEKTPKEIYAWFMKKTTEGVPVYQTDRSEPPLEYIRRTFNIRSSTVWTMPKLTQVLDIHNKNDVLGYEIELFLHKEFGRAASSLLGAVNYTIINDPTSFHLSCLVNMLKERLAPYMEDIPEIKAYFLSTAYRLPVSGYVMATYQGATFAGQTKYAFEDVNFAAMYTESLRHKFASMNDLIWDTLFEALREDIESKFNSYSNKGLNLTKDLRNVTFRLKNSGTYIPCKSRDRTITELLIAEGDSAGGQIKQERDPAFQAVLYLRGKPLNGFRKTNDQMMANAVYSDLVTLTGVSPMDKNLDNMHFKSIGILTDADVDGYHIASLIVGNLHRINPLILESGRVWVGNPPLYRLAVKDKSLFLRGKLAMMDAFIDNVYSQVLALEIKNDATGAVTKLKGNELRDFYYLTHRIGEVINRVAVKLSISPILVEAMAHCVDHLRPHMISKSTENIRKVLGVESVKYNELANMLILTDKGLDHLVPLKGLEFELRAFVLPELNEAFSALPNYRRMQYWKSISVYVTTLYTKDKLDGYNHTQVGYSQLYDIMEVCNGMFNVERIKGLGEMPNKHLGRTCVNPATRVSIKITSVGDVQRIWDMLGSDVQARKDLTTGSDVVALQDF